jgi:hypothetical protein
MTLFKKNVADLGVATSLPGIRLGNKVKDSISGIEGLVTARFEYLYGCVRCEVQPEGVDKDGKPFESIVVDEQRLSLVKPTKPKVSSDSTPGIPGGPRDAPRGRTAPKANSRR